MVPLLWQNTEILLVIIFKISFREKIFQNIYYTRVAIINDMYVYIHAHIHFKSEITEVFLFLIPLVKIQDRNKTGT